MGSPGLPGAWPHPYLEGLHEGLCLSAECPGAPTLAAWLNAVRERFLSTKRCVPKNGPKGMD